MSGENNPLHLPSYQAFIDSIAVLKLPCSGSELHGIMCGYLSAGAATDGEAYLRALLANQKDDLQRRAAFSLFSIYSISQHQLTNFDFEFQLLLPTPDEALLERAKAFSDWCEGFTQAMFMVGVDYTQISEEDTQEALQHIAEFAQLDYDSIDVEEEDEEAFTEVSEYTRMAVLGICNTFLTKDGKGRSGTKSH